MGYFGALTFELHVALRICPCSGICPDGFRRSGSGDETDVVSSFSFCIGKTFCLSVLYVVYMWNDYGFYVWVMFANCFLFRFFYFKILSNVIIRVSILFYFIKCCIKIVYYFNSDYYSIHYMFSTCFSLIWASLIYIGIYEPLTTTAFTMNPKV